MIGKALLRETASRQQSEGDEAGSYLSPCQPGGDHANQYKGPEVVMCRINSKEVSVIKMECVNLGVPYSPFCILRTLPLHEIGSH